MAIAEYEGTAQRKRAKVFTKDEKTVGVLPGYSKLLGEEPGISESAGRAINRAFGGWIPGGQAAKRIDRARGGRVKGKTTVNVIVGGGPGATAPAAAPPPPPPPPPAPPPVPPRPVMPGMGGMPPPGPPPMMRARGGRTYTGGAGSGVGREEKIERYGKNARSK